MAGVIDPQAQAMDRMYRRQRLIYDVTRKYYLLGRDRLIGELAPGDGARVLEIGCGTGRNLIVAAKRFPQARFCGLDISREMLETAAANVRRAGLEGRIVLAKGDAASFDAERLFGTPTFERVFCAYTLSMIPPWQAALAHGARLVAPNGALFVVDFGRMDDLPRWFRHFMKAWLAKFGVTPRGSLGDTVERLDGFRVETAALYRGYAQYAVARRR